MPEPAHGAAPVVREQTWLRKTRWCSRAFVRRSTYRRASSSRDEPGSTKRWPSSSARANSSSGGLSPTTQTG